MGVWAANSPENFTPHLRLLEAEEAAVGMRPHSALPLYEKAIEAADRASFPNVAGLAAMRASEVCRSAGLDQFRERYQAQAAARFEQWGAVAIAEGLRREMTGAGAPADPPPGEGIASPMPRQSAVEYVLAHDTDRERRIEDILGAAAMDVGARFGCYIAMTGSEGLVAAEYREGRSPSIEEPRPMRGNPDLAEEIVLLAGRTGQDIVLGNARTDPRFASALRDRNGPFGAILCIPTLSEGAVVGALYLAAPTEMAALPASTAALRSAAAEISGELLRRRDRLALQEQRRTLRLARRKIALLEELRTRLATFVPRDVATGIMASDSRALSKGAEKEVSVLFLDIQSYTTLVEKHGAPVAKRTVETYFSAFYDEILRRDGEVSQMEGDSLLAIFEGAEGNGHPARAVEAAIALRAACRRLNGTPGNGPGILVNIGISSGRAIVGFSEIRAGKITRRLFSAVGSTVNLAARIAAFSRDGDILIGQETRALLPPDVHVASIGLQRFRNVSGAVEAFRIEDETVTMT